MWKGIYQTKTIRTIVIDNTDLTAATQTHSRLSVELDKLLKGERDAKFILLQKEADIRKEFFPQMASKEISQAYFKEILKDQTLQEYIDYEKAKTERIIKSNQLAAAKEVLYSIKIKIKIV